MSDVSKILELIGVCPSKEDGWVPVKDIVIGAGGNGKRDSKSQFIRRHLRLLVKSGKIERRKYGRSVFVKITQEQIDCLVTKQ